MIACALYDYIEIACLYRIPVKCTLFSGEVVCGIANGTQINQDRQECIKLTCEEGEVLLVLDQLKLMEAIQPNPHFQKVAFQ